LELTGDGGGTMGLEGVMLAGFKGAVTPLADFKSPKLTFVRCDSTVF
jgi:hypothetical protein